MFCSSFTTHRRVTSWFGDLSDLVGPEQERRTCFNALSHTFGWSGLSLQGVILGLGVALKQRQLSPRSRTDLASLTMTFGFPYILYPSNCAPITC